MLKKFGFEIVKKGKADFILVYGGDGSILYAEREYPSIPKLVFKTSIRFRKFEYSPHQLKEILKKVGDGNFRIQEEMKLEATFKGKKLIALNEFQVRVSIPTRALRFSVYVNRQAFTNLIGDGVVVSTPFGSTGYYKSIGGKPFRKGIGIGFNNLHNTRVRPFVIDENLKVRIKVLREDAYLLYDNSEEFLRVRPNESLSIRKAKEKANFILV